MKNILVLGGTMFVGRALVEKLQQQPNVSLTLFNRGKSNAGLFANVHQLHGNRETADINQITNRHWDVVIDFSGYYPTTFAQLLQSLQGKVGRYIFISTISVYDLNNPKEGLTLETDPILACSDTQKTSQLPDAYGEKKAEMERLLLQHQADAIILRPSFIYGRYDWTDRFYYWLYRARFNQTVAVMPPHTLSLTYANDLATAILNAIYATAPSQRVYNTISFKGISLHSIVQQAAQLMDRQVQLHQLNSAPDAPIHNANFPLYVPYHLNIEGERWKQDFGVQSPSFEETLQQTIQYHEETGWYVPKAGLTPEQEDALLQQLN